MKVRLICYASAAIVILVSCVGLAGWLFNVAALRTIVPVMASMKENTAIALALTGISMLLLNRESVSRARLYAGRAAAAATLIVAGMTVAEYALGLNLWIDKAVFFHWFNSAAPYDGRMSLPSAVALALLNAALLLTNETWKRAQSTAEVLTLTGGSIGLVGFVGYPYSAISLYKIQSFTGMALPTSFALTVAAVGIACSRPQSVLMKLLLSSRPGGVIARRLLPTGVAAPIILGWLGLSGQHAGYYGAEAGMGLLVVILLLIFVGAIVLTARTIDRSDHARQILNEELAMKNKALQRSNEELRQFAHVASHDLQEPLRMVASYTQLLASRYKGCLDSDADEFITFAVEGCVRMKTLIQDLLSYSHAGEDGRGPSDFSVEDVLRVALTNLQVEIKQSEAMITHDPLPALQADEQQLIQIFQTLVGNAIKYRSTEAPRIHVSASNNGAKGWAFSVQDNGMGIDSEHFQRIFVIFQRLHGREDFVGTGIGLAICKKIVERMGGKIWVESRAGKGATFYFTVPKEMTHDGHGWEISRTY